MREQGIGEAAENFLLGASAMGYGACYMIVPFHAKDKIEEIIGLKCSKSNSYFKIKVHTNIS